MINTSVKIALIFEIYVYKIIVSDDLNFYNDEYVGNC